MSEDNESEVDANEAGDDDLEFEKSEQDDGGGMLCPTKTR